jgi:DNA replication protein DnaC
MAKPDCKLCSGTGWVVSREDALSSAERCSCVAESRQIELEEKARIPKNYWTASVESFIWRHDNPTEDDIRREAAMTTLLYAREFPPLYAGAKPGLLLSGPPGTGKTHLAIGALRQILARGHDCMFVDYQNLLDRIRAGYSETLGTSAREAYQSALEVEVLLLDDLGAHRVTDWVEDTITAIIAYRYNHRKATIVTTNFADQNYGGSPTSSERQAGAIYRPLLEQRIGERARSRLFEMCKMVALWGVADYRLRRH